MVATKSVKMVMRKTSQKGSSQYMVAVPRWLSRPRTRHNKTKKPPMTVAERLKHRETARMKAYEIRTRIANWRKKGRAMAEDMAETYRKKASYFMDMMYQGGVHLVKPRNKPNAYCAFKAKMVKERREAGLRPLNVIELKDYDAAKTVLFS
ncbi:hypothetical protein V5O48_017306 [Marasmius crinis-equi]|uniref:Uncharacterized protein n=1 Tax=Marasmius crinis-equi TaxID=585013 RepID=A0ABR3EPC1_9AGAR